LLVTQKGLCGRKKKGEGTNKAQGCACTQDKKKKKEDKGNLPFNPAAKKKGKKKGKGGNKPVFCGPPQRERERERDE